MDEVKTVKVVAPVTAGNELGYVVINEADFDAATMEKFAEPTRGKKAAKAEEAGAE